MVHLTAVPFSAPPRPLPQGRARPRAVRGGDGGGARPLGQILLEDGAIGADDLVRALALQAREAARLGDILLAHGMVDEAALCRALARQRGWRRIDPLAEAPDVRLIDRLGAARCLRDGVLPWRDAGGAVVVLAARPEVYDRHRDALAALFGPVVPALASEAAMAAAVHRSRGAALARAAETRVPLALSCRAPVPQAVRVRLLLAALAVLLAALLAPRAAFAMGCTLAVAATIASTVLKALAAGATIAGRGLPPPRTAARPGANVAPLPRLPMVSILVPLYRETDIAPRLVARLSRLSYPRELLDVVLLVEATDSETAVALARARLPRWMRVLEVPDGPLHTKPRALNFGLTFCRGSVIGVYDAEDAPEPDQIHRIVRAFAVAGPRVACVQGRLDYYNRRHNWMTRCFTIEYAGWFGLVLPGLARLGLPVPLGGTTLFFRRDALEELGGWDAHNVTEDADLGLRLWRAGWRTILEATVTEEEATSRPLPWIRQRSRWIKGYAATWAVHMRDPARLWRDLGPAGFVAVQALFLGSLVQAFLAPFLWSFWLVAAGLPHPLGGFVPGWVFAVLIAVFLLSEAINLTIGMVATSGRRHRGLRRWAPTLHAYYPMATLAAYKAGVELIARPFHWDKTMHGRADIADVSAASAGP